MQPKVSITSALKVAQAIYLCSRVNDVPNFLSYTKMNLMKNNKLHSDGSCKLMGGQLVLMEIFLNSA